MTSTEPGHFPRQVGIDAYGNSGFRFAEMSHRGSLLCLPTGMHAWAVTTPAEITLDSLAPVLASAGDIDVLMIGLGHEITGLSGEVREALRSNGIIVEAITTGSAVRTYNVLLGEKRAVAAALIAVDRVR
jgi:uncharacterized protein